MLNSDCEIVGFEVRDIRFPTSKTLDGSDAMNPDPDYSAAYLILKTNLPSLEGHGLTFTIGRGNDICVEAIKAFMPMVVGKKLRDITQDMGGFWRTLNSDSQLRWLGPEKGVMHISMGAVVNAIWDLYAKVEKKPLWRLIADMSPEELVACVDFTYITDVITPEKALKNLQKLEDKNGFIESIKDLKNKRKKFFNLGPGNNWKKILDKKFVNEIENSFKDEMKELGYI